MPVAPKRPLVFLPLAFLLSRRRAHRGGARPHGRGGACAATVTSAFAPSGASTVLTTFSLAPAPPPGEKVACQVRL